MRIKTTKYKRLIYHSPIPEKEEEKPKRLNISDTLLLGIVPLMGYGLLFAFYSPYLGHFGIPIDFMSFDLPELLICIFGVLVAGLYFPIVLNFLNKTVLRVKSEFLKKFIIFILINVLSMLFILLYAFIRKLIGWQDFVSISFIAIILFSSFLVLPLFSKAKGNYIKKVEAFYGIKKDQGDGAFVTINKFSDYVGFERVILSFIYLWTIVLLIFMGGITASSKSQFYVVKVTPECVIVYSKSDSVICKTVDRERKEFFPDYKVYFYSDLKGVDIVEEHIGQLKSKPTSTPTVIPTITPILSTPTIIPIHTPTPIE